ncbi:hypothetical protein GCM10007304_03080 [Rhodococcoides trifolii]|uniref:OmpR/PhoB-type domain-containing protein n=1 Tax=Rhodococcoides trifolii TaxID=908250 RepID=A0A917CLS4_9NOCA|nr:AfsR/SARP family transcriptional regulator [Rhodococcus trifolii]GGF92618.1 hypothetical protein GCM10007304_03080 [Rhodococcus trifolii]
MDYALIGSMEARHRGTVLDLGGRKQRAVLAVLLLARDRVVEFDRIVDDVWDAAPPPKAMASVRAYVANLRRILDTPGESHRHRVITSADGYRLNLGSDAAIPDTVDIDLFDRFCATARDSWVARDAVTAERAASDALRLWRGTPLVDFRDHSFAYDEAQRLEQLYADTFEVRVDAQLSRGVGSSVISELESRLRVDPLRETLWVRLMLALHRSGRRADALIAFDRARSTLATELGIEPGEELVRTHDDVRGRRSKPPKTTHRSVFGRDDELEILHRSLRDARAGRGRIVVITGAGGLGKTALASEISADAQAAGFATAWSSLSVDDRKPVLWDWTRVLRRLGVEDSDAPDPLSPYATAVSLRAAIGSTPTVIVLDDFHLADAGSNEVLAHVEKWIAGAPLVVVTTWLDGSPDLPRRRTLGGSAPHEGDIAVLPLTGLDGDAVAALVQHLGGITPSPDVVARILARTGGNPLHVRDAVRLGLSDNGSPFVDDDRAEAN